MAQQDSMLWRYMELQRQNEAARLGREQQNLESTLGFMDQDRKERALRVQEEGQRIKTSAYQREALGEGVPTQPTAEFQQQSDIGMRRAQIEQQVARRSDLKGWLTWQEKFKIFIRLI